MNNRLDTIIEASGFRRLRLKGWDKYFDVFMRAMAFPFVYLLSYTPITANLVSLLGIFVIFASAYFFATSQYLIGFLFFAEVVDYMDGTIARIRKEVNFEMGSFLGRIYHIVGFGLVLVGALIGLGQLTLALIFGLTYFTRIYLMELRNSLLGKSHADLQKVKKEDKGFFHKFVVFPVSDGEVILAILLIAVLFNILHQVMVLYTIHSILLVIVSFVVAWRNIIKFQKSSL